MLAYSWVQGHCHLFRGHFLFNTGQNNISKYFDVLKRIHDPWYTIKKPNTIAWKTSPYHDFCTSMLWMNSWFKLRTAVILNITFSMKESVTQNKRCAFEDSGVCCFSVTLLQVNYLHCRNFTTFIITVDHQVTDVVGLLLFF